MDHLSLDKILSYIDNSIDTSYRKEIENHLSNCDECFMQYSTYKISYEEIENLTTPSKDLVNTVKNQLININPNIFNNLKNKIYDFFVHPIYSPAFALSVAVIIILYLNLFNTTQTNSFATDKLNYSEKQNIDRAVENMLDKLTPIDSTNNNQLITEKSKNDSIIKNNNTIVELPNDSLQNSNDLYYSILTDSTQSQNQSEEKLLTHEFSNKSTSRYMNQGLSIQPEMKMSKKAERSSAIQKQSINYRKKIASIPDLDKLTVEQIVDTLNILKIKYEIIYSSEKFRQIPKYEENKFIYYNQKMIIYHTSPKP